MTTQITVVLTGIATTLISNGKVTDAAGNLWDLPASVTIPSVGTVTVVASVDAANPGAIFPGTNIALAIETPVTGWSTAKTAPQITPPVLRSNFPEFASATPYPDAFIQYWLTWAYTLLNASRWGASLDQAAQLYAAHNLTMERRAVLEAAKGAPPGNSVGPASAKAVDKVSVSYDIAAVSEKDGGDWNQTIYGRRLYRLLQMFGMGPIQVGVGFTPPWVGGFAWPGPPCWPGAPGWGN